MYKIILYVVATLLSIRNAVELYDGNFDLAVLGWVFTAALLAEEVISEIQKKIST